MSDINNHCPDCGELLRFRRGVVPMTATAYCPSCLWCSVSDGDRQKNAKEDWYVRNVKNRPEEEKNGNHGT